MTLRLEVLPHRWEDERGDRHAADCYPFVEGEPVPELATCGECVNYEEGADLCLRWRDEPENAPIFCGPICFEFIPAHPALRRLLARVDL